MVKVYIINVAKYLKYKMTKTLEKFWFSYCQNIADNLATLNIYCFVVTELLWHYYKRYKAIEEISSLLV